MRVPIHAGDLFRIETDFLVNGAADRVQHGALDRVAQRLGVDDQPAVVRGHQALHPDVAGPAIDLDIGELEADIRAKTQWAIEVETRLTAEVRKQTADLVRAVEALHHTEKELEDRTAWALRLQEEAARLEQQLALVRASRWMRLGRKVGLGPTLPAG